MMRRIVLVGVLLATACSKPQNEPGSSQADALPPTAAPAAAADAGPPAADTAVARWTGTYSSNPGTLYIPADWKGVHWSVPDSSAGLGDGPLNLTIDAPTGRVSGAIDGPLGPATLDGFASDGGVAATLTRKDPSDRGFTGTMVGAIAGDKLTGTMHVSAAEVSAVRTVTFALTPSRGDSR
jgi:hypothetical protein